MSKQLAGIGLYLVGFVIGTIANDYEYPARITVILVGAILGSILLIKLGDKS